MVVRHVRDMRAAQHVRHAALSFVREQGIEVRTTETAKICERLRYLESAARVSLYSVPNPARSKRPALVSQSSTESLTSDTLNIDSLIEECCRQRRILFFDVSESEPYRVMRLWEADPYPSPNGVAEQAIREAIRRVRDDRPDTANMQTHAKLIVPLLFSADKTDIPVVTGAVVLERAHSCVGLSIEFQTALEEMTAPLVLSAAAGLEALALTRSAASHDPWHETIRTVFNGIQAFDPPCQQPSAGAIRRLLVLSEYAYSIMYTYGSVPYKPQTLPANENTVPIMEALWRNLPALYQGRANAHEWNTAFPLEFMKSQERLLYCPLYVALANCYRNACAHGSRPELITEVDQTCGDVKVRVSNPVQQSSLKAIESEYAIRGPNSVPGKGRHIIKSILAGGKHYGNVVGRMPSLEEIKETMCYAIEFTIRRTD